MLSGTHIIFLVYVIIMFISVTACDTAEVEENIQILEAKFKYLKKTAIKLLNERHVEVGDVVYELTELPACEVSEHETFLKVHLDELERCNEHRSLFARINGYWNYLSPQLLYHLIDVFLNETAAKQEMAMYDTQLNLFRNRTPLVVFCQIDPEYIDPPKDFVKIKMKFKKELSNEVTLQHVENFRLKYARHYRLREFALMLFAGKLGSFIIFFLVPECIIKRLKHNVPHELFKEFCITEVIIAGHILFGERMENIHYTSTKVAFTDISLPTQILSDSTMPFSTSASMLFHSASSQVLPGTLRRYASVPVFRCSVSAGVLPSLRHSTSVEVLPSLHHSTSAEVLPSPTSAEMLLTLPHSASTSIPISVSSVIPAHNNIASNDTLHSASSSIHHCDVFQYSTAEFNSTSHAQSSTSAAMVSTSVLTWSLNPSSSNGYNLACLLIIVFRFCLLFIFQVQLQNRLCPQFIIGHNCFQILTIQMLVSNVYYT